MVKVKDIRMQYNTDSVDIDQKCSGVDCWVNGDSLSLLNTNRVLHIQIRHNKDKKTFECANKIANLISAAPDLLQALNEITRELSANYDQANEEDGQTEKERMRLIDQAENAIKKAEGRG